MTALLNMQHPSLRILKKKLPEIQGKMLARGCFTTVYPRNDKSVWKLTVDEFNYGLVKSDLSSKSNHFPTFIEDRGKVGEVEGLPIYLYAAEKLYPCKSNRIITNISRDFCKRYEATGLTLQPRNPRDEYRAILAAMSTSLDLPCSIRSALNTLRDYTERLTCSLDLGNKSNYMLTSEGVIVLNDPIYDEHIIDEFINILNPDFNPFA